MIYKYMYNESKSCPKSFSVCVLLYVVIVEKHSKYLLKFLDDNYILYANILPGFIYRPTAEISFKNCEHFYFLLSVYYHGT